jgi:hypothetical protein
MERAEVVLMAKTKKEIRDAVRAAGRVMKESGVTVGDVVFVPESVRKDVRKGGRKRVRGSGRKTVRIPPSKSPHRLLELNSTQSLQQNLTASHNDDTEQRNLFLTEDEVAVVGLPSADIKWSGTLKILAASYFDKLWAVYPKRENRNPKKKAARAWNARIREGIDPERLLEGAVKYAAYIRRARKEFTEFVMMTTTFLGPDENWAEAWDEFDRNGRRVSSRKGGLTLERQRYDPTPDDADVGPRR